jgi:FkbM family methyltransferase
VGEDFRRSPRARRQSWYGTKRLVKRVLGWRLPHLVLRRCRSLLPSGVALERLPAPAHVRSVTGRVDGASFTMLRPDRCVVAKELYWGGGRRPRPQDQLALETFARLVRDADVVLDVGAYTGIFALLAAAVAPRARVHAFEIVPANAMAALENVVANDALSTVTVHLAGVGEDGSSVRVPLGTGGSALPDFYSTALHFESGVRVPVVSLDAVARCLPEPGPACRHVVMKIDVEGSEEQVLRSGGDFLARWRPDILCELLPGSADVAAVEDLLRPHGYRYLLVGADALVPRPSLVPDARLRDWLFTRLSDHDLASLGVPVRADARSVPTSP